MKLDPIILTRLLTVVAIVVIAVVVYRAVFP